MDRDQDESVVRITARYVAEMCDGRQPRLSEYLARYPQYQQAIADYVAYYHVFEAHEGVSELAQTAPESLSELSCLALERALSRIQGEVSSPRPITTLLTGYQQHFTLAQLAVELDLSVDVVTLLERRMIEPSTLPFALYRRLATLLHQPVKSLQVYFSLPAQTPIAEQGERQSLKVAEERFPYSVSDSPSFLRLPFSQVLKASTQLSPSQRVVWQSLLADEGL